MSDDLTDAQIEELRDELVRLRGELEEQLEAARTGSQPVDLDQPIGRVSRVDALQQQQMASANRRSLEVRLRQVAGALAAMRREEYGLCRRCEEPIAYERLRVRPETPFCLACQGAAETRT